MRIQIHLPLLILVAASGLGCSEDAPTAPPVPGSVGGFVTSTIFDGYPMQNAVITVEGKVYWTGLDGRYLIEGITPGSHVLIASRWDHLVHEDTVTITAGELATHDVVLVFPGDANATWMEESFGSTSPASSMPGD